MKKSRWLVASAFALPLCSVPVAAQETTAVSSEVNSGQGNEIIVTARRMDERLQDVPISITVLSGEDLANNNIMSAKDITTYTPGLVAQGRYGSDSVAFTIRGFSQEQRTTATVGTYFADVVMPRGSGANQGGDGAGPGALFDLANVQVLKGPQGTLQGRNSTGGAVLLVPRKPTGELEGYVEGTIGNYDQRRIQAVVNVPVHDTLRVRFGVDRNKRDGFQKNIGNLGSGKYGDDMGSTDYWALRFSTVADLTPDIENYAIASYVNSKSNPPIPKLVKAWENGVANTPCSSTATSLQCDQVAREAPFGRWAVSNSMPDAASTIRQWQVINTTKWQVSDNLTIKNIFAYAEFRQTSNVDLSGGYWLVDGTPFGSERPDQVLNYAYIHAEAATGHSNAQSTLVEEIQLQGRSEDGRFIWQGGFYFESNDPLGLSGVQSGVLTPCTDIATFNCRAAGSGPSIAGQGSFSVSRTRFRDRAVYGQASYDLTDQLTATAGLRYTWDRVISEVQNQSWRILGLDNTLSFTCSNATAPGFGTVHSAAERFSTCGQTLRGSSEAPTWLLGLDYKPLDDMLVYAKWARGYRQGGVTIFGADPIQPYGKETVDTYELGSKLSWRGAVPGHFNVSAFYNDFRDQQLQAVAQCDAALPGYKGACTPTTAIANAGKSKLYGFEAELGISPVRGLRLQVAYAYLKTEILDIPSSADILATLPASSPYNAFRLPEKGDPLNFAMPHKVVASVSYELPVSETIGRITLGGTYIYQSAYRASSDTCRNVPTLPCAKPGDHGYGNGILPAANIINLSVGWEDVFQLPIDASAFVTNVTNELYYTHTNDNLTRNFVSAMLGEPRMYGVRLRFKY